MGVSVRRAQEIDVDVVAGLVHSLLAELSADGSDVPGHSDVLRSTGELLTDGTKVWAFLAIDPDGEPIGVLTLNQCAAIYAGGEFGEICELYVVPDARSQNVAPKLLSLIHI